MLEEFAAELLRLGSDAFADVRAPRPEHVGGGAGRCGQVGRRCQRERQEGATVNIRQTKEVGVSR